MTAYYNEHDPFAAEWLRNLIRDGHIASGEVDERDIRDVAPADLRGFAQCHFFAGIGVWSYALRRAGWPDDRPVWTGSCPCQPFSAAGKGGGFADERHLLPAFFHLIEQCGPRVVFGEQVASKDGLAWLDLVQADLEGAHYAVGAVDTCAAGIGAPHIRQRLWWVADAERAGVPYARRGETERSPSGLQAADGERQRIRVDAGECGSTCGLADTDGQRQQGRGEPNGRSFEPELESSRRADVGGCGEVRGGGLGYTDDTGLEGRRLSAERARELFVGQTGVAGFWRDADWLYCRDGKYRPVEPGTFPLAHGAPARVGRLRGYGNAINAEVAKEFISAYLEWDLFYG